MIKNIFWWERVLSFAVGVLLFLYFDIQFNQFVWGLFFALVFSSAVVITQCIVAGLLIARGVKANNLIAYWSTFKIFAIAFWSISWRLFVIAVIWPIKLYLCFLLLEYLFPYIDVFSVTFLFNDLNFYKAEVLPLLLISIASILLIDWRLAVAPLLAVCQQLQSIERLGNQVVTKVDRSSKRTTSNQPHKRFGESIGEIFTFYYVEISKYWLRIMMICVFYIILKAFNCSDFFTVVVSHAILCLTINLTLSK